MGVIETGKPADLATPLVSVVVTTYQHAAFIRQCLDGILMQQTNFDFEIILGEDESVDGTREICMKYAEKHPDKIRLFLRNRQDVIYIDGSATGRHNALQNIYTARGKYIAICEGDDYWTDKKKLQIQVDFLEEHPEYAVCFHRVFELRDDNKLELSNYNNNNDVTYTIKELALDNFIHTPSVVFRNHLFSQFPEWINSSPVLDYVLHMLNSRYGLIKYFGLPMACYRRHRGGLWSALEMEILLKKWIKVLDLLMTENFEKDVIQNLGNQRNHTAEKYLKILLKKQSDDFSVQLKFLAENNDYIKDKWLFEYYPKEIKKLNIQLDRFRKNWLYRVLKNTKRMLQIKKK